MSAENPTDVIEMAAKIIYNNIGARPAARALHDAGLLADPADRDVETPDLLDNLMSSVLKRRLERAGARAERAEAELSNMEADYDRRGERLWRLAAKAGHEPHESDNDATAELAIHAELDRLRAQVAAVRALIWQWENNNDSSRKWAAMRLRAALDTAGGEQP